MSNPDEISVSDLAAETGLTVVHILTLIKRGTIPAGRKDGQKRLLPATEARLAVVGRRQLGPRTRKAQSKPKDMQFDGWAI